MSNKEAKKEAIKAAYGEHWSKFKHFTDKNGWLLELNTAIHHGVNEDCRTLKKFISESNLDFEEINNRLRLKSLSGIEDNLGWTRIEPDGSNLPIYSNMQPDKEVKVCTNVKPSGTIKISILKDLWRDGYKSFTHFKKIIEDKPPIF